MASIEFWRLESAYRKAKQVLLDAREPAGHWVGQLATSALSTATAVSALAIVERCASRQLDARSSYDEPQQEHLRSLVLNGIRWLADHQNPDGGWGDTDRSYSNIATTFLAVAAFHLTGVPANRADVLRRAEQYIRAHGNIAGLRRRYGKDKTFAVPILTNCALAGLVDWREVDPLPFELACFPQQFYRFLRLPVVSYALPALIAIGQARYFHARPWSPLANLVRAASVRRSLAVLETIQPSSGGYLEAIPLTSFVVMSLASTGRVEHAVTRRGVQFLCDSVRPDGSWPIDTNLATWNTTLSVNALAAGGEDVRWLGCLDWLLKCQYQKIHPYTGAEPGGWGWSNLSGAVPDADDTPGALLALAAFDAAGLSLGQKEQVEAAARAGLRWLMDLQNRDGGWPTFCRGWGKLPFDRSGADLTAHALRAIQAWSHLWDRSSVRATQTNGRLTVQAPLAVRRGLEYLARQQHPSGSWVPLWFGNQDHPAEENPVYGTARVLQAYTALGRAHEVAACKGWAWLIAAQNADGGWGPGPEVPAARRVSSVEETALAVETLASAAEMPEARIALEKGLIWLMEAVEQDRFQTCSPIGFYFAKLWYYEKLYPIIFTVAALGRAVANTRPRPQPEQQLASQPPA